jgi:DNA/RNA-binding domain of Phe-tRNA-synthetase-like protein
VESDPEKLTYLEKLRDALITKGFAVQLVSINTKPYLKVANAETPRLNERVHCEKADDGSWCYWWPWRQPVGSVDDLESVTGKVTSVLRSVEGES